jgi:hypothetical protein
MKPLVKYHSIVLSITTLIVFSLWELFANIGENYSILKIVIAAITSIGFYRILMLIAKSLILNIRIFKKWIFASQYIEGVWVGFFMGKSDKVRYYIETFEQDFESITIRGKGFRENEGYFGSWISESVNFDDKKGTLNYTYKADALSNTFINPGLADFVIERKESNTSPYRMFGFSADLYNPKKMKSFEEKIRDKPDIGNIKDALGKAKQLYQENQYFLTLDSAEETVAPD